MIDSEIAARLTEALVSAAGPQTELVSANITILARADVSDVQVNIDRQTKTMKFLSADARTADGARIASAASVHKVLG